MKLRTHKRNKLRCDTQSLIRDGLRETAWLQTELKKAIREKTLQGIFESIIKEREGRKK